MSRKHIATDLLVEMLKVLLEVLEVMTPCWPTHDDLDVQVDKSSDKGLVLTGKDRVAFLVGEKHGGGHADSLDGLPQPAQYGSVSGLLLWNLEAEIDLAA